MVNWGDGTNPQDLGAVVDRSVASHTYNRSGAYVVTGTLRDTTGNPGRASVVVFVTSTPER